MPTICFHAVWEIATNLGYDVFDCEKSMFVNLSEITFCQADLNEETNADFDPKDFDEMIIRPDLDHFVCLI